MDIGWTKFLINEWYFNNIFWRIHHYIFRERCENCRNYHYKGKMRNVMYGNCDIDKYNWVSYHGYCACWNLDCGYDHIYTTCDDGSERLYVTPTGKSITQIARSGIWMYLYDGEPKWYGCD